MREQQQDAYEDDDVVDTVDELRREVAPDRAHHHLAHLRPHGPVAHVVEERRAEVARHDDDRVAEVDDAPLAVSQPSIVKDLEEELVELPRGLLNLVDEDDGVRLPTDVLCELATLVVADVARRSTNDTSDRVLLRVLGTVDTNHRLGGIEK